MEDLLPLLFITLFITLILAPIATWVLCAGIRKELQSLRKEVGNLQTIALHKQPKESEEVSLPSRLDPEPKRVETPSSPVEDPPKISQVSVTLAPSAPPPLPRPSVPKPVPPPVQHDPVESVVGKIWKRIWNWIVVGEEYRKEGVPVEYAVATNWLVRIGVLIVVAGLGFFLDYTAERGWLGPVGQLAIALTAGTGALLAGWKLIGKQYDLLAQGFFGLGVATWYGAMFAAEARFQLINDVTLFVALVAVTIGSAWLSVRVRSLLVGVLSVLGGYAAPLLISGGGPVTGLVVYTLMLGLLVVGIAKSCDWPVLTWLGLAGHGTLLAMLLSNSLATIPQGFLLATGGFLIFSSVPFLVLTQFERKTTLVELGYLFGNAGVYFFAVRDLLSSGVTWNFALVLMGLSVFHMAVYLWLQRREESVDRTLSTAVLGLGVLFAFLAPPELLSGLHLTVVWSVFALVLMGMAVTVPSRFLQRISLGVHSVVALRLAVFDFVEMYRGPVSAEPFWSSFVERLTLLALPIFCLYGTLRLLTKRPAEDRETQTARWWIGSLMFLTCLAFYQLESGRSLGILSPSFLGSASLLGWFAAGGILLLINRSVNVPVLNLGLVLCFGIGFLHLLLGDAPAWHDVSGRVRMGSVSIRWLDFGIILTGMLAAYREFGRESSMKVVRNIFGYGSLILTFLFTSREVVWALNAHLPGSSEGGLSVYWAVFALTLISAGLIKRLRPLRFAGLTLFTVTAVKIMLIDLADLDAFYRILAFLLFGGLMLAGAFAYLKFQDRFVNAPKSVS